MSHRDHKGHGSDLSVSDVMTSTVVSCGPDTSLHDVAALLWQHDIGALPVINGSGREQVCAMITDRDIAMAAYTQGRPLHELRVRGASSSPAHTCRPSDGLFHALDLMSDAAIRRLVVVDADNLAIGIVSLSEIARAASSPLTHDTKLERATCWALSAITAPPPSVHLTEKDSPDAISSSLVRRT